MLEDLTFLKPFCSCTDSTSSTLKLEWIPDHKGDEQTSGIYNAEPLITSGDPAWNCRDTSTSSKFHN